MTLVTINVTADNINGHWTRRHDGRECPIAYSVKEVVTPDTRVQVLATKVCLDLPKDQSIIGFPNGEGLLILGTTALKPSPFTFQLEIPNVFLREEYQKHDTSSDEMNFKEELYELVTRVTNKVPASVLLRIVEPKILGWYEKEGQRQYRSASTEKVKSDMHARLYIFTPEERKAIVDSVLSSF